MDEEGKMTWLGGRQMSPALSGSPQVGYPRWSRDLSPQETCQFPLQLISRNTNLNLLYQLYREPIVSEFQLFRRFWGQSVSLTSSQ